MKSHNFVYRSLFVLLFIVYALGTSAVTATYYSNLDGKSGTTLFSALTTVSATGYKSHSYDDLWTYFGTTDLNSSGKIWDMYSDCTFTLSTNQCGSGGYSNECDCYNREHSLPKSWFGGSDSNAPGTDLFHIVPTDGKVNGYRSNYPFGEVSAPTYTSGNGSKLGPNTLGSYSGTAFEPVDEYKGDFARGYLGMVVRYANSFAFTTGEGASIFNTTFTSVGNYGLTEYGVTLLMKWHRQDPVSQKEIDRNNRIQATQGNRNPFIDYPCLAEYLWGNSKDATVTLSSLCGSFETGFVAGSSLGCSSCSSGSIPTVTSPTYNEGSAGGNITSLGDPATITENGIYYSTTNGFADGAGTKLAATTATTTGTFSVDVSTLPVGTYYFKAFAKNSAGIAYSTQGTFTIANATQVTGGNPTILIGQTVTNALTCTGTKTLLVRISNLSSSVNITSSNTGIVTVSPSTISPVDAANGVTLTVTRVSNGSATIIISGGVVNQTINVTCQ